MREEAAGVPWPALERVLRVSRQPWRELAHPEDPTDARVPDYGKGRPLTLGERKALARRPDIDTVSRLAADPHPDVIRGLLENPRLTEDTVLRMAAKRPCRPDVLAQIARSPKWVHRARIRLALALNPDTSADVAIPILALLLRQELELVVEATHVSPVVRAVAAEHLERRPPMHSPDEGDLRFPQ